ncbi:MAG: DUF4190 domain-containing protein [Chloroflexota bacterium]
MSDYQSQQPAPAQPNSTMAIISLVSGILGWTFVPLLGSIAAIITGHMAKKEIKESMGNLGGDGMATIGLVLGYVSAALFVCGCLFFVIAMGLGLMPVFWSNGF